MKLTDPGISLKLKRETSESDISSLPPTGGFSNNPYKLKQQKKVVWIILMRR